MIIKLLLQAIYSGSPLPDDPDFYKKAMEDVQFSSIAPQTFFLLKKQKRLKKTPGFFQAALKKESEQALYQNLLLKKQLDQLLEHFESIGIDVIPLKGSRFAEKYFGHLGARRTGDIDVLVKPMQMEQVVQCISTLGFSPGKEYAPEHFHKVFSKTLPGSPLGVTVEIHWHILRAGTSNLDIGTFWEQARAIEPFHHIKELSPLHTFYMICLHGWNHDMNGWRYFIDIVQLIHELKDQIDYDSFLKLAAEQKTLNRVARTLSIVYHEFPHLEAILPLPQKKDSTFWWNIDHMDLQEQQSESAFRFVTRLNQLMDYDTNKQRLVAAGRMILPDPLYLMPELGEKGKHMPVFIKYMLLYGKRIQRLFKVTHK